jgi:hypothetical protein
MEFFREIKSVILGSDDLKEALSISTLPEYCSSIETIISEENNEGEIYCLWGQFNIKREIIKYGVRFSLLNCPHALAWTITFHQMSQEIIIHCTIDKKQEDKDFIDSIHQFVSDWERGLGKISQ